MVEVSRQQFLYIILHREVRTGIVTSVRRKKAKVEIKLLRIIMEIIDNDSFEFGEFCTYVRAYIICTNNFQDFV